MKPKSTLRNLLALAGSSILAFSSASATTYTWTQTAIGNQDWTAAGNWDANGVFVSGAANELRFFADITTILPANNQTVINVPTTLSLNTLTLNGRGPNGTAGFPITIGTSASTWTLGDGTTSTVNLNSALGGGTADRDMRYTIAANLALTGGTGGITTFTGTSGSITGAVFSGNITETASGKGITKSGSSLLIFSGNNSYTGTTSVTGGTLRLSSVGAINGGLGTTGGLSALTINGGVVELGATNFSRGLGTGSSQFQITGGTSGFSARDGQRVVTVNGDASEELQWGSTHFAPTTLVLNAATANNSIELTNKIDLNAATRTVQVNADKALLSGTIRTASGTAGLTKSGAGMLVLTGNNTYNGTTTISAGALSIDSASNIGGSGSDLIMSGGSLQIRGTTLTSLSDLDSTVTFSNTAKGFDIQNAANTFTVNQVLSGTGTGSTLTKSGVGTLVLNQNNTFAGATTATGGGSLVLDYTTNNDTKLSNTAALTLSGGALVLKGGIGAGANHAEVVSSTAITTYTSNSISRDGGSSTISLGGLTLNTNSSLSISEANLATTTSGNTNGILTAGRVTVGSHFGSNDGSNNIVAYGGYTTATIAGVGNTNLVHQLTGGGTMAANLATYSLRIVNGANGDILDLSNKNINLTNNTTLLYAGGFDNQYTINGTGAVSSASGNQAFVINTYAGTTLTVNARTSSNFANVSKAGAGTLVFGGNNSTMAGAFVQEGVLRVTHNDGLGTTANGTTVLGGAALELANNIDVGAEALSLNGAGFFNGNSHGGALRNQSGTNSFAGAITIGSSGARINADTSTSLTLTGGITTTLTQDVTFGGAGNTTVSTTAISGSGSVIKDGAGTLTLSATNTYTGSTTVTAGSLAVNGSLANTTTIIGAGTPNTGKLQGSGSIGGSVTIQSGGTLAPGNSIESLGTGALNFESGSTYAYELQTNLYGTTPGLAGDLTFSSGTLDIQAGSILTLTDLAASTALAVGSKLTLISYFGGWTETELFTYNAATLNDGATFTLGLNQWRFDYNDTTGGLNYTADQTGATDFVTMTVVPEPNVAALLGGFGMLALLRRRRN